MYDRDEYPEEELPAKPIRWFMLPIALVAYVMLAAWLLVFIWQRVAGAWPNSFVNWMAVLALVYIACAFVIHKLNLVFEAAVFWQIGLVLAPLIILVNNRAPERDPVYMFLVPRGYSGELEIRFVESAEMKVRSSADTLWFAFDDNGRIALREDYRKVQDAMRNNLRSAWPDGSFTPVHYVEKSKPLPTDTVQPILMDDSLVSANGKMTKMLFRIGHYREFLNTK